MLPDIIAVLSGVITLILGVIQIFTTFKITINKFVKNMIPILILIGIIVILLSYYFFYQKTVHYPNVNITEVLEPNCHSPIKGDSTGFIICVKGNVLDARHKYLCLVVDDQYHRYVQPNSEEIITSTFLKRCYLGIEKDTNSINKTYTVFAAVIDRKYSDDYEILDPSSVIIASKPEYLFRYK